MGLWYDIERLCGGVKHAPEHVDMEEVRLALRRAQTAFNAIEPFLRPDSMTLYSADDNGDYTVSLTGRLSRDQYVDLLQEMYEAMS